MSNVTGTIRGRVTEATTPIVYNVSVASANTEVSQALSGSTKQFLIRVRDGNAKLQLAFNVGESGTDFITLPMGTSYYVIGLNFSGTLYFQTNKASQVVEILEWT